MGQHGVSPEADSVTCILKDALQLHSVTGHYDGVN